GLKVDDLPAHGDRAWVRGVVARVAIEGATGPDERGRDQATNQHACSFPVRGLWGRSTHESQVSSTRRYVGEIGRSTVCLCHARRAYAMCTACADQRVRWTRAFHSRIAATVGAHTAIAATA